MSSCKFYHDCILARIKCQKKQQTNKQKQKNWLDTLLTSKEKWDQVVQWQSHESGQLLNSVPRDK